MIITTHLIFPCYAALMLASLTGCANDQSHPLSSAPPAATVPSDQAHKQAAQKTISLLDLNTG